MYDLVNDPDEMSSVHGRAEYAEVQTALENELERLKKHYEVRPVVEVLPPKKKRPPKPKAPKKKAS